VSHSPTIIQIFYLKFEEKSYYNYKQRFSIVLLAICNSNYEFLIIDVGSSGYNNDAGVWAKSKFFQGLESSTN